MERRLEEEMAALQQELVTLEKTGTPNISDQATASAASKKVESASKSNLQERTWDLEPDSLPDEAGVKETSEDLEPPSETSFIEKANISAIQVGAYCSKKWWRIWRRSKVWIRRGVREAQASILDPSAETFQNKNAPPLLRNEKRRARNRFLALAFLFSIVIFFILRNIYSDY